MGAKLPPVQKKIILNSDGKSWRPNVHIRDIVQAILYAIRYDYYEPKPLILNVGDSSNNFQIRTIAEMIKDSVPGCMIEYLHSMKQNQNEGSETKLVQDKKIQDGVDKRTYKVVFDRIKTIFQGFECGWSVQRGIEDMVSKFQDLRLSSEKFRSQQFYRLQAIEKLFQEGRLNEDVCWRKK